MGDLIVVSKKKYKQLRRAAIVMPIVAVASIVVLSWLLYGISMIMGFRYTPSEGVWYCEELDFEVDFDCDGEKIVTDDDGIPYIFSCHSKSRTVGVYTIADSFAIEENGEIRYWYEYGELVYEFTYVSLKGNRYTIQDNDGNKYVFVRK